MSDIPQTEKRDSNPIVNTPNLSLEPCGGLIVSKNGQKLERYKSFKRLSAARGISLPILRIAASEQPPGLGPDGGIKWELFQPWLVQNYNRLALAVQDKEKSNSDGDSEDKLRLEKLKEEIIKLRYENLGKNKEYVSRKLVIQTVQRIRDQVASYLRQKLENEMPPKCKNATELELKAFGKSLVDEIFAKLSKPVSTWKLQNVEMELNVETTNKDSN